VARRGTLAERSPCHCEESTTRQSRPRWLRYARNDRLIALAAGAAEGAGGAEEADGVEHRHDDHDDADLRERRGPARQDERTDCVNGPRHRIELREQRHPRRHGRQWLSQSLSPG
jgi:hypothetical protein